MKHIAGWFRRNNLLMAQAKDLQRQLTDAWFDVANMREARDAARAVSLEMAEAKHYLLEQLHRVAQERDEERKLKLKAEADKDRLLGQLVEGEDLYISTGVKLATAETLLAEERDNRLAAEAALADCLEQLPNEEE